MKRKEIEKGIKKLENIEGMMNHVNSTLQELQYRIEEINETTMLWMSQSTDVGRRKNNSS